MGSPAVQLCRQARRRGLVTRWDTAPGLGTVLISGRDAGAFLQAQLTSDVAALGPGEGHLSSRLDRRGNLVAWFSLHRLPDRGQPFASYLFILPRGEIADLIADLDRFVITEHVFVEDITGDFRGLVIQGQDLTPLLPTEACGAAEFSLSDLPTGSDGPGAWLIRRSFTGDPGCLILFPPSPAADVQLETYETAARAAGLTDLADDDPGRLAWHWLMMEAGWPVVGLDLAPGERVLPQTGLEQTTVSLTKGCYLGQEVVARIRTYGSVPEALRALVFRYPDGTDLPAPGTPLENADGKKIGTWGSAGYSGHLDSPIALVFLDRASRTPGRTVEVATAAGSVTAEVALLPLFTAVNDTEQAARLHDRALDLFTAGQDAPAIDLLEQALRLDPGHTDAYEALGVLLGRAGKYHEAIDIFRRLEDAAPAEPMVHTNLSLFYMKIGDTEEAERQKALATLKKFGGAEAGDAERLAAEERTTRHAAARAKQDMFAEVLDIDPDDPLALMGMGRALTDLDDPAGAEPFLTRALEGQADNSSLYASLGRVLLDLDRAGDAADVLRRGIEVASRKGDLMTLREMEHRLRLADIDPA